MSNKIDLTGQVFGRLTVVSYSGKNVWGANVWSTICSCGQTKEAVQASDLIRKKISSCDAVLCKEKTRRRLPPGEAGFNALLHRYKKDAKRRGYEFLLKKEDFAKLVKSKCAYCGVPPSKSIAVNGSNGTSAAAIKNSRFIYNGIDRVDNFGGYTLNNCVPCCGTCNRIKMDMSELDLFAHIELMLRTYKARVK